MSDTTEYIVPDFDELCKDNPNYPRDIKLHRMYQGHIKKWRPLIQSNHHSIYTNWEKYKPKESIVDPRWPSLMKIVDKVHFVLGVLTSKNKNQDLDEYVAKHYQSVGDNTNENDLSQRRDLMIDVFNSYVNTVEHVSDDEVAFYRGKSRCTKREIITTIDQLSKRGYNPFDYWVRGLSYEKKGFELLMIISGIALLIWVYLHSIGVLPIDE